MVDPSAGDVIGGNFEVPDRMAGAMEEGRAVGASSCGQPLSPLAIKVRHCR